MVTVQKANKQLTIDEEALPQYLSRGFSQVDKNGNVIQKGEAKTLSDLKAENDTLKAEIDKLNGEKEVVVKENTDLKTENESLKAENDTLKVVVETDDKKKK